MAQTTMAQTTMDQTTNKDFRGRVPGTLLVLAACSFGTTWWCWPRTEPEPKFVRMQRQPSGQPAGYRSLANLIQSLARAPNDEVRELLLEPWRSAPDDLLDPALWVLEQPNHPLFQDTARLVAELRLTDASPMLREASESGHAKARRAALLALEFLSPLDDVQLSACLRSDQPEVLLTGLGIMAARQDTPADVLPTVLDLTESEDPAVRKAALQALPPRLPAAVLERATRYLEDERTLEQGIAMLGHLEPGPETAAVVARALPRVSEAFRPALLAAAQDLVPEPPVREAVWKIALGDGSTASRTAALRCLELAGDDGARLSARIDDWPIELQYQAARILVAAGKSEGVSRLVALAGSGDASGTVCASRELLSFLAHQPPHTAEAVWRDWVLAPPALQPQLLPPPPIFSTEQPAAPAR